MDSGTVELTVASGDFRPIRDQEMIVPLFDDPGITFDGVTYDADSDAYHLTISRDGVEREYYLDCVGMDNEADIEALAEARAEKDAADTEVEEATEKYNDALEETADARAQAQKGSFGFFEEMGAEAALNALNRTGYNKKGVALSNTDTNGKTFTSFTHQGEATDATSLENMKNAIQWMYKANELREQEDIFTDCNDVPLMVSDTLMAMAQSNANWSDSTVGHADNYGGNYNVGENLAWNYGSDPFVQWYDEEKLVYREVQANADLDGDGIIGDGEGNVTGHYTNRVKSTFQSTGFAICTRGTMYDWITFGQTFSGASYNGEEVFTVSDYEERFMDYYDVYVTQPTEQLTEAENALTAAQARQTAAAQALEEAQKNL